MGKSLAVAIMTWAMVVTSAATAQPHRGGGYGHGWGPHWGPHHGPSGALGGFFGGVLGGLLGSQLEPRTVIVEPPLPELQPWTPQWYEYCGKYQSFDPRTGYWIDYRGVRHFCGS